MSNSIQLDPIEEAVKAIKNGEVIIVVDDEDRENEGDFICAAEKVTPEIIKILNETYKAKSPEKATTQATEPKKK
jgi:3,4-dihydroxy 2-butanone 4-phosphate synthase/GTP cyclohydrolase II